jgi:hypothetical protein
MRDPVFAKAVRNARKSHPNFIAMVARRGLTDGMIAEWERRMDEEIAQRVQAVDDDRGDAATLPLGQRVVTVGLSTEWLNGATCSVASVCDAGSGRYTLRVHDPPEAVRKCGGAARLKRENLVSQTFIKPRVDPARNWVDEFGWVCSKAVKHGEQCPRSHDVVCQHAAAPQIGACSVCDEAEARDVWSCYGGCGYNVCGECRHVLKQQQSSDAVPLSAANVNAHEFPMLVTRFFYFNSEHGII